jgi:hypothetical protein
MSKSVNFMLLIAFVASSIFVFFPALLSRLASFFGIGRGVDFAFYIIIPLIAIVAIRTGLSSRKNRDKIVQFVRAEAIDNFKKELNAKSNK